MKTVNSVSGGQTSAYMMKHYPADFNLFALVELEDVRAAPADPWIKKYFESKTGKEFIATAEDDVIAYTLSDLEQYTGQEITFVVNPTFDEVLRSEGVVLPSAIRRFCTARMKVKPIAEWVIENIGEPVEMRIGFRAGEDKRVQRALDAHDEYGYRNERLQVGTSASGRRKFQDFQYAVNSFPLHTAGIHKDKIVEFWKDKPVRFAERNNCVGCFHRNPILLNLMSQKFPEKYQWFTDREEEARTRKSKAGKVMGWNTFRRDGTYEQFKNHKTQLTLDDLDGFQECDSGYCGL
jgi:hypothetical protein